MTPWTVTATDPVEGGTLLTVDGLHPDGTHQVMVSDAALENRRGLYLCDGDELLTCILWEHFVRLNPGTAETVPDALYAVWGPDLSPLRPTG